MMSRCFTWFPIGGYRRTQLYHHLVEFTRIGKIVEVCLTVKN